MNEQHNNHNPGYIPQIGIPDQTKSAGKKYPKAIYHRATGPGFFGVAILCFFMSFINIKCNGHVVDHYSGFDVIRGKKSSMNAGTNGSSIAVTKSAYFLLQRKKEGSLIVEETNERVDTKYQPMFDIPKSIDETSSNPQTTRMLAIIALICAASGAVLSILKNYWGAVSQFFLGALGFIALFLMQFYLKITVPKISNPGSPLYAEYQTPAVTTELALGYWLALLLFLGVTIIGYFRIKHVKRTTKA